MCPRSAEISPSVSRKFHPKSLIFVELENSVESFSVPIDQPINTDIFSTAALESIPIVDNN